MKLIIPALVCLLLAGMWLQDVDTKSMHVSSSNCCYITVKRKISPRKIQCYKHISSTCSYENRLILKLTGGLEACVFQKESWVQAYLRRVNPCL